MDLVLIELNFKLGRLLALTPPSLKRQSPNFFEKVYIFFVFSIYTVGEGYMLQQKITHYSQMTPIRLILRFMLEGTLFIYNFYSPLALVTRKRQEWFNLVENFGKIECLSQRNSHNLVFIVSHVVFGAASIFTTYVWLTYFGFMFYQMYILEYIQVYSQYFYTVFACIILRTLLSRYEKQSILLRERLQVGKNTSDDLANFMKETKFNMFTLREIVDTFNEIFGWVILFCIVYGATKFLNCLYDLIKGSGLLRNRTYVEKILIFFSQNVSILLFLVSGVIAVSWNYGHF